MLRPQHRPLLAVTTHRKTWEWPHWEEGQDHIPATLPPQWQRAPVCLHDGYLGNQARQDVRQEVSMTHTSQGHFLPTVKVGFPL